MSESKKHSDFSSLVFPKDRLVLKVCEIAPRWLCTNQHVINLLEEGKLNGFNVAGFYDYLRVPASAITAIAQALKVPHETVLQIISRSQPARRSSRAHWRVPVREGFSAFIQENGSLL